MAETPKSMCSNVALDGVIDSEHSRAVKSDMMNRLKWNALFHSVSDSAKFIASPLFAMGATILIVGSVGGVAVPIWVGVSILGAAAASLVVGVTTGFFADRIWQEHSVNVSEMNAKSTAKCLVNELKANNLCLTQEEKPCRNDGKSWQQFTAERDAQLQAARSA